MGPSSFQFFFSSDSTVVCQKLHFLCLSCFSVLCVAQILVLSPILFSTPNFIAPAPASTHRFGRPPCRRQAPRYLAPGGAGWSALSPLPRLPPAHRCPWPAHTHLPLPLPVQSHRFPLPCVVVLHCHAPEPPRQMELTECSLFGNILTYLGLNIVT